MTFAFGKLKACVMKKWAGKFFLNPDYLESNSYCSPREAIECLKRALLGADPSDTNILLKLAKLFDEIEEYVAAAAYHQLVIDICSGGLHKL